MKRKTLEDFNKFTKQVEDRLSIGEKEYGDRNIENPGWDILDEINQELADVYGWSFLLWKKIESLKKKTPKVVIKSVTGDDSFDEYMEATVIMVNDKKVGAGTYGGDPAKNRRCRHYHWVEDLFLDLCKKLGASVEKQQCVVSGEEWDKIVEN